MSKSPPVEDFLRSRKKYLHGKTILISGASRGIGRSIALRAALDGANVVILAKTTDPNPKLPGTIYSVAAEVEEIGGNALPIACDIRDEVQVEAAIKKTVERFGGIDVLVNNASAISLTSTADTSMKKYDLMQDINVRGAFCLSKAALPHLLKSSNPHILTMSPPLSTDPNWYSAHPAYTVSKMAMSLVTVGLAAELNGRVSVNSLWPRTIISTSALQAFAGDQLSALHSKARKSSIMADAAYAIITQSDRSFTGQFLIDEIILRSQSVSDFSHYAADGKGSDLETDLFLDPTSSYHVTRPMQPILIPYKSKL